MFVVTETLVDNSVLHNNDGLLHVTKTVARYAVFTITQLPNNYFALQVLPKLPLWLPTSNCLALVCWVADNIVNLMFLE